MTDPIADAVRQMEYYRTVYQAALKAGRDFDANNAASSLDFWTKRHATLVARQQQEAVAS